MGLHRFLGRSRAAFVALGLLAALLPLRPAPAPAAAPPNLVLNGSFEQPDVVVPSGEPGWFVLYGPGEVPGWTIVDDGRPGLRMEIQDGYVKAADGEQLVELDARRSTAIEQQVPTTPGEVYVVEFSLAATPRTSDEDNKLEVTWDGELVDRLNPGAGASRNEQISWNRHRYAVRARDTEAWLRFRDLGVSNAVGTMLDDVRVYQASAGDTRAKPADFELDVLDEQDGWSRGDGLRTYGGARGTVWVVDELDPASELRKALAAPSPSWIVFASDTKIVLDKTLDVADEKTIDARGHNVVVDTTTTRCNSDDDDDDKAGEATTALSFVDREQLVILNVDFDDNFERWETDCEGSDAVQLHGATRVWLHHNRFRQWSDGAVDMKPSKGKKGRPSSYVTVSWNRFERIRQAALWTVEQASFHHNVCSNVHRRCPRAVTSERAGRTRIHSYNNVIENWGAPEIESAVDCEGCKGENAVLWSEANVYVWPNEDPVGVVGHVEPDACLEREGAYETDEDVSFQDDHSCTSSPQPDGFTAFRSASAAVSDRQPADATLRTQVVEGAGVRP